jgi:hypothetical protein
MVRYSAVAIWPRVGTIFRPARVRLPDGERATDVDAVAVEKLRENRVKGAEHEGAEKGCDALTPRSLDSTSGSYGAVLDMVALAVDGRVRVGCVTGGWERDS